MSRQGGSVSQSLASITDSRLSLRTGRIIFEASDGELLEVTIANADMTETYAWTPTNSAEVVAFVVHVQSLSDNTATLTLTDEPAGGTDIAPAFADDTGDAQSWVSGTAITSITVPAATGTPTPTYAVQGTLPAGISFNTTTRVISGTPTAVGSGTITIRARTRKVMTTGRLHTTVATATAPSTPAAPTLTVDSDTQITAVGVAPDNGGSTITSYDWRHRVRGSGGGGWVNRTNVTNLTQVFTGLTANTEYDFRFRATNNVDSPYSPIIRATTDGQP